MSELARVTIDTPDRRLDIAAPAGVPVADLMRVLVRAGGEQLAERGAATGWVVRRDDGVPLSGAKNLQDQGVRDGDVLHLVRADESWPELEYDDITDAIAATRRESAAWTGETTRRTGIGTGTVALLLALFAIVRDSPPATTALIAGGFAAVLLGGGIIVARVLDDGRTGVALAAIAIPYAFVAGLLARGQRPYAMDLLIASVVVGIAAWFASLAVGRTGVIFTASCLAAAVGVIAAVLDRFTTPVDAAAIVLSAVTLGAGLVPGMAVRLGGLGTARMQTVAELTPAVARSDIAVAGLSGGIALVAAVSTSILGGSGLDWPRLLAVVCLIALARRARAYGSIRQRFAALAAAAGVAAPLIATALWTGVDPVAVVALLVATGSAIIVGTASRRPVNAARAANWLEAASLLSVLPLLAGALNLYAKARALH